MKRWHEDRPRMLRRWRLEIAKHEGYKHMGLAPIPPQFCDDPCHCYRGPGFLRKRHPYDCGKSRCSTCHYEKFEPKRRAKVKRVAIEEGLLDYGCSRVIWWPGREPGIICLPPW